MKYFNPTYAKTEVEKEILRFLQQHNTLSIATVSAEGWPHVAIASYVCEDNFDIYLTMKENSIKYANILRSPKVGIAVGDSFAALRIAHIRGEAEIIRDPHHFIIDYFNNTYETRSLLQPVLGTYQGKDAYLKIHITWLRWLDLDISGSSKSSGFEHIFPQREGVSRKKVESKKETVHV